MTSAPADRAAVVKIGGSTLGDHDTSLSDLADLHRGGDRIVVVHGGGAAVSDWMTRMGREPQWVDGLRVTTPDSLEVVAAVLRGLINAELVRALNAHGAPAVGLAGVDAGILRSPVSDRLGLVGETPSCDPDPLHRILDAGLLPVVAPVGLSDDGATLLNINADAVAGAIADALPADRLIFLTDVPGVLDQRGCPVPQLTTDHETQLDAAGALTGGMLPKLRAGRQAQTAGVQVRIVDGRRPSAVRRALADTPCSDGTVLA